MSIRRLLQSPRARRGIAASAIVLSLGGLVLFRAPTSAADTGDTTVLSYVNGANFSGPGASGNFSLSHGKVLANGEQRIFAQLRLRADQGDVAFERAPLALVIVLDTSGSMDGSKIAEAKRSAIRMLSQMRPDDEVAFVRYDSNAALIQPMATVGAVRSRLISRINELDAGGGTNIPWALRTGMSALRTASSGRVKRLVLVSDGLDSTRSESEGIARSGTDSGVTVSALGIGLDFDEAYMSSVARAGRGNFGFVEDASSLARFLERELSETASTTIERAVARIQLPDDLRFVRAIGADVRQLGDGEVELRIGSLFAGDERRVVIELEADAELGASLPIDTQVSWQQVAGRHADVELKQLNIISTDDLSEVNASRDARVWANGMSALASVRQIEAAQAYASGDRSRATQLIEKNMQDLAEAEADAPAEMAGAFEQQRKGYAETASAFEKAPPRSAPGRAAAKRATARDTANLARPTY